LLSDEEIVEKQLGRKVKNLRRVVKRCKYGYPIVVESFPLKDGKPFPTLYWLTCIFLRREISRLESEGWIKKFEDRIKSDKEFFEKVRKAHEEVRKRRVKILPKEVQWDVLIKSGTGGIKDPRIVKCLHLHTADFLAGIENPIGEMVLKMLEKTECDPDEIICEKYNKG